MLLLIGPLKFEVAPFNATAITSTASASFAEKAVLGARPPLEFVGDGGQTWSITAKLFPEKFGGQSSLTILNLMRLSGAPQYMMRGDGLLVGWVVVETVTESSSYLNGVGVGRMIDVDIGLKRSGRPSLTGYFKAMGGAVGGLFNV